VDTLTHLQAMAAMEDLLTILTVDTMVVMDTLPTMATMAMVATLAILATLTILATQPTPMDIILPTMDTGDKRCI
jgi:hypothetical protein